MTVAAAGCFKTSQELYQNWYVYYTSYSVIGASLANVYFSLTGHTWRRTTPPLAPNDWWVYRLEETRVNLKARRESQVLKEQLEHALLGAGAGQC